MVGARPLLADAQLSRQIMQALGSVPLDDLNLLGPQLRQTRLLIDRAPFVVVPIEGVGPANERSASAPGVEGVT